MKRIKLLIVLLLFACCVQAQNLGVGVFGGVSTYLGDLSARRLPAINTSSPVIGISVSKALSARLVLRGELNYTALAGDDKYSKDSNNVRRNLSFETSIFELNMVGELYLLKRSEHKFSPYIIGGLGVYHFNPYTQIDGNSVYLKPLSTEGEGLAKYPTRKPYKLTQMSLIYGAGIKYSLTSQLDIKGELSFRKLFTDYLDDVSKTYIDRADLLVAKGQLAVGAAYRGDEVKYGNPIYPNNGTQRGNPLKNDSFYYIGIAVSYSFDTGEFNKSGHRGRANQNCPVAR